MKTIEKIKIALLGLLGGLLFALGIIIGVKIDKDIVIKGKIKQKTGKGGKSDIRDVSNNLNINRINRNIKKELRKQKKEFNKLNK